jgi:hypothetical protein
MRKLFILCIGIFFAQQAAASSQCTLKAEDKMHCADCETLEEFAFYGASALYASRNHQQRSIQVTANNGSDVYVEKGLAWNAANLTINLGRFGEWGVENVPYPTLTETQVTAYDINHKVTGTLPNDGKFANGALNAKCKQIEKKLKEMAAIAQNIRNTESVNRIEGESIEKYLQRAWLNGVKITNGGRSLPWDDCSACRSEEVRE